MTIASDTGQVSPSRSALATTLDRAGWGCFFIWVGVCFLAGLSWAVFFFGTGVLMLVGQGLRKAFGSSLDFFGLLLGLCFVVGGGLRAFGLSLDHTVIQDLPMLFIVLGAAILVSAWRHRPRS